MRTLLRYFCGSLLVAGILLVPTGTDPGPAPQHEAMQLQEEPEAPAAEQAYADLRP